MKDLIIAHRLELTMLVTIVSVIINLLLRFNWTRSTIEKVIDDTLKVNDGPIRRFSGTKITMMLAFASVLWAFHFIVLSYTDLIVEVFLIMAFISTGVSLTGALSKKISPPAESTSQTEKAVG